MTINPNTQAERHILVVGLSIGGLDAEILRGFNLFRRHSAYWVLHDAGHQRDALDRFLKDEEAVFHGILANVTDRPLALKLLGTGIPLVDCSGLLQDPGMMRVSVNNQQIGHTAAQHFAPRPFRSHLFISNATRGFEIDRWKGFSENIRKAGGSPSWIVLDTQEFKKHTPGAEDAFTVSNKLKDHLQALEGPVAVFAASDRVGMQVCDTSRQAGLSVPGDVSVLGVDDVEPLCESCEPPLSSIRLPGERIGFEAGRRLQEAMQGNRKPDAQMFPPHLVHSRASTDPGAGDSEIACAIRYMREHLGKHLAVKDIAQHVHMHPRTFLRHFQQEVGRNPHEELLRIRIEEASRRLLREKDPIYQIATDCGFGDADQFGRHFKKATGLTPSQFRA